MNIEIRKFKNCDVASFYQAVLDTAKHASGWLPWCNERYSLSEAEQWVRSSIEEWEVGNEYRFVIVESDSQEVVGSIAINNIIKAHKIGNLGYWVRGSCLNKGVCSSAEKLVIEYAFKNLNFSRIEIVVLESNVASIRVAEKIGATYEGTLKNKISLNGISLPARCYSVIPQEKKAF